MTELVAAFSMLGVEPSNREGQTSFSKLSQEAQDAIVWAAMSGDDETPPKLSEAVRDEIIQWASESGENAGGMARELAAQDSESTTDING